MSHTLTHVASAIAYPDIRPDFARNGPPPANPLLLNQSPEMFPQPGNPPQGWGFGGFLAIDPAPSGRGANSLWWTGLANCFWWIDREKGVAGMIGAQVGSMCLSPAGQVANWCSGIAEWRPKGDSSMVYV
jgi:hypothetical protein